MFYIYLQLFGGRGGSSGGSGLAWGSPSQWDSNRNIENMDEYMDVLRTIMNDDKYGWDDDLQAIKWIWEHIDDNIKKDMDQFGGPMDRDIQAVLHGMSINLQNDFSYTTSLDLNTVTLSGYRNGNMSADKYRRVVADYLQNKVGNKHNYKDMKVDAEVIRASPKAVNDLARKGEKSILSQPDSYKKYKALEKKIQRADKTGRSLSQKVYDKHNELFEKYHNSAYDYEYNKRYGR